jgi:FkbM family methyltransferase
MDKREIRNLLRPQDPIIFEIGCADGKDTQEFINTLKDIEFHMYCFEPEPRNAQIFRRTISDSRVHFYEIALGDSTRSNVPFYQSNTEYSSSLLKPTEHLNKEWPQITFDNMLSVTQTSLDDFVASNSIPLIDFIWADVQGAEHLLISGAQKTLTNKVKYFYTEYSDIPYYAGQHTLSQLLAMLPGYTVLKDYGSDVLLVNTKV